MTDGDERRSGGETRLERRIWISVYVVMFAVLAVGALRRIAAMF
jgi:hypothetical protein